VIFTSGLRVCLAAEPADLRRSFEGLVLLVKNALSEPRRKVSRDRPCGSMARRAKEPGGGD
jgi:hypothetical protein